MCISSFGAYDRFSHLCFYDLLKWGTIFTYMEIGVLYAACCMLDEYSIDVGKWQELWIELEKAARIDDESSSTCGYLRESFKI